MVEYCSARAGTLGEDVPVRGGDALRVEQAGSPPAKLITSGRAVTARMSRTGEPPIDRVRAASGGRAADGAGAFSVTVMPAP